MTDQQPYMIRRLSDRKFVSLIKNSSSSPVYAWVDGTDLATVFNRPLDDVKKALPSLVSWDLLGDLETYDAFRFVEDVLKGGSK